MEQLGRGLVSGPLVGLGEDVHYPVGHPLFTQWSSAYYSTPTILADLIAST